MGALDMEDLSQAVCAAVLCCCDEGIVDFVCERDKLRRDRDCLLAVIRHFPAYFSEKYFSLLPRVAGNDAELLEVALRAALREHPTLEKERMILHTLIPYNGMILKFATDRCKCDLELVLMAVRENGLALQHVASDLRSDFKGVLAAVRQNGHALQYASEDLRQDDAIVLAAFEQTPTAAV